MSKEDRAKEDRALVEPALTDNAEPEENPQLALAALASMDNQDAREKITSIVEPLIAFQTDCFCKRFCGENHLKYHCRLPNPVADKSSTHSNNDERTIDNKIKRDCEWASASTNWMLDYLTNKQRLLKFTNRHGDSLYDYFFQIINSLAFFQRWKDWRMGSAETPLAIQNMGPAALRVFKTLQQQRKLSFIAEQTNLKLGYVEALTEEIIQYLNKSHSYHDLQPNTRHASDTSKPTADLDEQNEMDVPEGERTEVNLTTREMENLNPAWNELSVIEQFVIEAIIINQQPDETILYALKTMDVRLKEGVLPEETTSEILHNFKTDSLVKLTNYC